MVGADNTHVCRDLSLLHPTLLPLARSLAAAMEKDTILRVYETYRHPARQDFLFARAHTKAKAWQSAHQYGLAIDFAGVKNGGWTWDVEQRCWDVLHQRAAALGLSSPIAWDKGHIQHPHFDFARHI